MRRYALCIQTVNPQNGAGGSNMAKWEYCTLLYGSPYRPRGDPGRGMRQWVINATSCDVQSRRVGESGKPRFIGRIWQAMRLLETALKELDGEGWELVSTSFSGIFSFYGTAVLRRPIANDQQT